MKGEERGEMRDERGEEVRVNRVDMGSSQPGVKW